MGAFFMTRNFYKIPCQLKKIIDICFVIMNTQLINIISIHVIAIQKQG